MATLAPGQEKENDLINAGFSQDEIDSWKSDTASDLTNAGYSSDEVDNYFGYKNPDMTPTKKLIKDNIAQYQADNVTTESTPKGPRKAETFEDAVQAGFQMSVTGLLKRGQVPDVSLPEDAPTFYRMASQVAGLAGDLPAMLTGSLIGGTTIAPLAIASGPAAPVVEAAGAGAGAFALPAGMRKALMDHYEKGDVQDFQDFWERASGALIEASKQGVVGAATAGVGGTVAKVVGPLAVPAVKTTAQLSSEVATMVGLGKAIEGEVPHPQDFLDAAILVGGLHGVTSIGSKLRSTYSEAGAKPTDVALRAQSDPLIKQDLMITEPTIPDRIAAENGISNKPLLPEIPKVKTSEPLPQSDAEKTILSKVGEEIKAPKEGYSLRKAYTDYVDKLDPINEAVKILEKNPEKLTAETNPYQLARVANDYKSKTQYVMEKGTLDYNTLADTGKSFKDIIEPFKNDPSGFEAYLISKRTIEVEGKGLKSGFDLDAAKKVVAEGKGKYEQAAQDLYDFKDKQLKYLKDSGVIGEKEFQNMTEMNKSHVSFSRLLEQDKGGTISAGGKNLGSLKEFKGSDLKIQSPLLSTLENTESIFRAAEKNRAVKSLVDLADKTPGQDLISLVEKPKGQLKDNQFAVYKNGERAVYEAPKDVATAIKSLDGDKVATNIFMKIAKNLTGLKKLTLTVTPDFIVKNFFRDQLTAGSFSKGGSIPFLDSLIAMKDVVGKSDAYYNWLKSGGGSGAFLDLNKNYLENNIFKLNKETGIIDKTWNVLKTPIHFLEAAGSLAEQATRLAEFKRVSKGETSGSKVFEGGFASREVTVDFSRIGAKMSALNSITAFQNVSIQGLDRTIRAIKDDPVGVTTKAVAAITVPSVLLWYANKDDKRVEQIPRWQKDTFWIIPTDNWQPAQPGEADSLPEYLVRQGSGGQEINKGIIYRIPKPQELGILFGSLPERVLEAYFTENPNALKDFGATIENLVTPSFVPDAVAPFIEQKFNKGLFTGNKIVPGYLESVAPEYQYTEYTSESAKQLAKMIKYMPGVGDNPNELSISSPLVIDNYVRAWSGNIGVYATRLADKALIESGAVPDPLKPADTLADVPVVKAFVIRYPSASAQSIQDFYTSYDKQKQKFDTLKHLGKTGDIDNLEKELNILGGADEAFVRLDGIRKALSTQNQFIRLVNKNQDYTPDEKRQLIDGVYYGMIETSKQGNDILNALNKAFKAEKDLNK